MDTRILLNRWDESVRSVYIEVVVHDEWRQIASVHQSRSLPTGAPKPATVSAPSSGSMGPALVAAKISGLSEALRVLDEIEGCEWGRITPPQPGLVWGGRGQPEVLIEGGVATPVLRGWVEK